MRKGAYTPRGGEPKTERLPLLLTETMRQAVRDGAARIGTTDAEYVRRLIGTDMLGAK